MIAHLISRGLHKHMIYFLEINWQKYKHLKINTDNLKCEHNLNKYILKGFYQIKTVNVYMYKF